MNKYLFTFAVIVGLFNEVRAAEQTLTANANLSVAAREISASVPTGTVTKIHDRLIVGGQQYGYIRFSAEQEKLKVENIEKAILRIYLPYDVKNSQTPITVAVRSIVDEADNWTDGGDNPRIGEKFEPILGSFKPVSLKVSGDNDGSDKYYEWDVTELVQEDGAGIKNGTATFRVSADGGVFRFNGRDDHPVEGNAPELIITTNNK
jgi:hypothetical protein